MADMIDAKEAKQKLGCDDATLQSHVNNGTIRAQRVGGKLMLNAEDVAKLAGGAGGDDDGTIVLTGDSDDLSIDLGKVVDDSAETIVQGKKPGTSSDSITFGDELEVVSFDDNAGTSELNFDDTKATGKAGNLSFTDSNTAVMTAVDETAVGATTAPLDFQTNPDQGPVRGSAKADSARRSVRSGRGVAESAPPVHWIWPTLLCLTLIIGVFFIIPFYAVSAFTVPDEKNYNGGRLVGVDAGYTSGLASAIAGFTVEPNKDKFVKAGGVDADFIEIPAESQATWRHKQFRDTRKDKDEAVNSFVIEKVDLDAKTATGKGNRTFTIKERTTTIAGSPDQPGITEQYVEASR